MAKHKETTKEGGLGSLLFANPRGRRRSGLVLARFLAEEAESMYLRGEDQDRAHEILVRWANLERDGHLARKETSLDANFMHEVLGQALHYDSVTESPNDYQQDRNFTIPEVGTPDGVLGNFVPGGEPSPIVVVELKGADVDLDRDKSNGRTAVQQCWEYLNALPNCPWGIVSNFVTTRLYHRNKTQLAYEEFRLQELRDIRKFRQFYCLFERGGLVRARAGRELRALKLLEKTEHRQRTVGDELYTMYNDNRVRLIQHLHVQHGKDLETAIFIAQRILDRIIFIAFCEDRDLLPAKCIDRAYQTLAPFSKVTNPRWRNFLDLFEAVDRGHGRLPGLENGYNGGLFARNAEVDDLQLDDEWTNFFRTISTFDFRDEVNVDVLGHIFEKSVAELEKLRLWGLFSLGRNGGAGARPAMTKSAERKRFGIYYTPRDFTELIVAQTVKQIAGERLQGVRQSHGLTEEQTVSKEPSPALARYWQDCFKSLRTLKVCDPACGSGAFLIEAYDALEDLYEKAVDQLLIHDPEAAERLADDVPDAILADNLFGVDLSPQAVEITQLALWIRSARRNKTLATLSSNIIHGNSLVSDAGVHPRAVDWKATFPAVFSRTENPGFDCVIGNPPWERLKVQEREFFAFSAPEIAGAVSAATRRRMIEGLATANPELYAAYCRAQNQAEQTLAHARQSGEFPLTGKGDVNTYMLFAELAQRIVAPGGRVGLLVPSGIATDTTTKEFFGGLTESQSLTALYDFENRKRLFPDVDGRFKFSVLLFGGSGVKAPSADFVFFAHRVDDLDEKKRHIRLSSKDLALLNPNTRTCPIFRSRRDAELTKAVYRRVPVLIDRSRKQGGNPWGIRFFTMFHQTNDAELFHTADELQKMGLRLDGNRWRKGKRTFLPLYEAKMVQAYDHRAAGVVVAAGNWVRQGQTEPTTPVLHQNPEFVVQPRWWVDEGDVAKVLGGRINAAYLCYKDVTSSTNQRTMIAAMIPHVAVVNSAPLVLTGDEITPRQAACLLANLNSLALDFVARQKVGGVHLNFFIVEQLPVFPPERYAARCAWHKRSSLEKWISDRVLKLTCTADDMRPLAEAAEMDSPVHRWDPLERAEMIAELDAAFFLLYDIAREDVQYILSTFRGLERTAEQSGRLFDAEGGILAAYDRLSGDT
ncbi:MAG: DNA methyltransferase [Thermoguttaceae bacterium]|jgi:hypothetical protein